MNQHTTKEFWDEKRVTKLIDLQKVGLSCAEIAAQLGGVTRSAVIGKLYRLGIKTGKPCHRFWTEERLATLRRLWAQGYSGHAIAINLNARSGYAVIDKAHKIGLSSRFTSKIVRDGHIQTRRMRIDTALRRTPPPDTQFKCTLFELSNNTCRWPLWDDETAGPKFFCGAPEADNHNAQPYCQWHTLHATRRIDDFLENRK